MDYTKLLQGLDKALEDGNDLNEIKEYLKTYKNVDLDKVLDDVATNLDIALQSGADKNKVLEFYANKYGLNSFKLIKSNLDTLQTKRPEDMPTAISKIDELDIMSEEEPDKDLKARENIENVESDVSAIASRIHNTEKNSWKDLINIIKSDEEYEAKISNVIVDALNKSNLKEKYQGFRAFNHNGKAYVEFIEPVTGQKIIKPVDMNLVDTVLSSPAELGLSAIGGALGAIATPYAAGAGSIVGFGTGSAIGRLVDDYYNSMVLKYLYGIKQNLDLTQELAKAGQTGSVDTLIGGAIEGGLKALEYVSPALKTLREFLNPASKSKAIQQMKEVFGMTDEHIKRLEEEYLKFVNGESDGLDLFRAIATTQSEAPTLLQFDDKVLANVKQFLTDKHKKFMEFIGNLNLNTMEGTTKLVKNIRDYHNTVKNLYEYPKQYAKNILGDEVLGVIKKEKKKKWLKVEKIVNDLQKIEGSVGLEIHDAVNKASNILGKASKFNKKLTVDDLFALRKALNDIRFSKAFTSKQYQARSFISQTIKDIDNTIYEAIENKAGRIEAQKFMDSWTNINREYYKMKKVLESELGKKLKSANLKYPQLRDALPKLFSQSQDFYKQYHRFLPYTIRRDAEMLALNRIVENNVIGDAIHGMPVIDSEKLIKNLAEFKPTTKEAKLAKNNVEQLAKTFSVDKELFTTAKKYGGLLFRGELDDDAVSTMSSILGRSRYWMWFRGLSNVLRFIPKIGKYKNVSYWLNKAMQNPLNFKATEKAVQLLSDKLPPEALVEFKEGIKQAQNFLASMRDKTGIPPEDLMKLQLYLNKKQTSKLAKTFGISKKEAQQIIDDYWTRVGARWEAMDRFKKTPLDIPTMKVNSLKESIPDKLERNFSYRINLGDILDNLKAYSGENYKTFKNLVEQRKGLKFLFPNEQKIKELWEFSKTEEFNDLVDNMKTHYKQLEDFSDTFNLTTDNAIKYPNSETAKEYGNYIKAFIDNDFSAFPEIKKILQKYPNIKKELKQDLENGFLVTINKYFGIEDLVNEQNIINKFKKLYPEITDEEAKKLTDIVKNDTNIFPEKIVKELKNEIDLEFLDNEQNFYEFLKQKYSDIDKETAEKFHKYMLNEGFLSELDNYIQNLSYEELKKLKSLTKNQIAKKLKKEWGLDKEPEYIAKLLKFRLKAYDLIQHPNIQKKQKFLLDFYEKNPHIQDYIVSILTDEKPAQDITLEDVKKFKDFIAKIYNIKDLHIVQKLNEENKKSIMKDLVQLVSAFRQFETGTGLNLNKVFKNYNFFEIFDYTGSRGYKEKDLASILGYFGYDHLGLKSSLGVNKNTLTHEIGHDITNFHKTQFEDTLQFYIDNNLINKKDFEELLNILGKDRDSEWWSKSHEKSAEIINFLFNPDNFYKKFSEHLQTKDIKIVKQEIESWLEKLKPLKDKIKKLVKTPNGYKIFNSILLLLGIPFVITKKEGKNA